MQIKPLSIPEKDRLIEIEFYLFVTHLLQTYNRSAIIYDIIDSLSTLYGCNTTLLRSLVTGISTGSSALIPDKEELAILFYKNKTSIRNLRKRLKIHPQSLYRYLDKYIKEGQLEYDSRLNEESFEQIRKFMNFLHTMMDYK